MAGQLFARVLPLGAAFAGADAGSGSLAALRLRPSPSDRAGPHGERYGFTATWTKAGGAYSYAKLSKRMIEDLDGYRFGDLKKVVEEAEQAAETDTGG